MNLLARYRKLGFWNKLFVWAACCSIASLILFLLWPNSGTTSKVVVSNSPGAKVATAINSSNVNQILADTVNVFQVNQKDNYARLREVAMIHGDGLQWSSVGGNFYSHGPSVVYDTLRKAVSLFKSNRLDEATGVLEEITHKIPDWPFAYYYLGAINRQDNYFEEAVKRCAAIRDAGINESAVLLCEALSLSALGRYGEARDRLSEIEKNPGPMEMLLVAIPPNTPSDIEERITRLTPNNWRKGTGTSPPIEGGVTKR